MLSRSVRLAVVLFALAPIAGARAATVWTPVPTGTSETITAIAPGNGGQLFFVTASGHVFHGTTAGFSQASVPLPPSFGFTDVAMSPDGTKGVAVGGHGAIFHTITSGATWSAISPQPTEANMPCGTSSGASNVTLQDNLDSVQFANATTVYITGDNQDILKSTDGGVTFHEVNRIVSGGAVNCTIQNASETFGDSAWVDANNGFFVSTHFGDIFSTIDGLSSTISNRISGSESLNSFSQPVALALDPGNPQRMWDIAAETSCGTLCLQTSTNGGSVWNSANFDGKQVAFRDVSDAGGTVIAVGDSGDIYTSADGVNFFRQPSADFPTNNWKAVDVVNAGTAFVGGASGHLIVSSTANQVPPPVGSITGPAVLTIGQSGSYSVAVNDPGGFSIPDSTYTWSTPGLANQTGSSFASFTFSTPGTHVITVAFRDSAGVSGSASLTVQVTGSSGGGGGGGGGGTITLPPSGSNPVRTSTGGATITIFRHVTVKGRKGRFIPVVLKTTKPRKFAISLVTIAKKHKRSKTLATLTVTIRSGTHTVHLNVPKSVKSGSYSLVVKIFTTGRHAHRVGRSVKQVFVLT